uniref:Uncharacterized protein n=1 Tax=Brassica campestris TaxID=3711 RepID=M4CGD1_BRACM
MTWLGPLLLLFGSSGPRFLRIPLNATVSQAVSNGHWNLPPARWDIAETLHVILSTTRVPSDANDMAGSNSSTLLTSSKSLDMVKIKIMIYGKPVSRVGSAFAEDDGDEVRKTAELEHKIKDMSTKKEELESVKEKIREHFKTDMQSEKIESVLEIVLESREAVCI